MCLCTIRCQLHGDLLHTSNLNNLLPVLIFLCMILKTSYLCLLSILNSIIACKTAYSRQFHFKDLTHKCIFSVGSLCLVRSTLHKNNHTMVSPHDESGYIAYRFPFSEKVLLYMSHVGVFSKMCLASL